MDENGKVQQEKPADAWGQPISKERQIQLTAQMAAWKARGADYGDGNGPFAGRPEEDLGLKLTGADVWWLAQQSGHDIVGNTPNLHLEEANLVQTHLEGAELGEAHMEEAVLGRALLQKAVLTGAQLEGAFFNDAHLEEAKLGDANLKRADLANAHLEGAFLHRAHLQGADLSGTWLDSKTDFGDALINEHTRFADIHWSGVGTVDLTRLSWDRVHIVGDEQGVGLLSHPRDHETVIRTYRQLAAQLRAQGMTEVADRFLHRAQVRHRKLLFRRGRIPQWLGSWFLAVLAGYGFRPGFAIFWYLVVVGGFALAYFSLGPSATAHLTWNEALVVSLTAFHGRGFFASTFQPGDPLAALAAGEAVIGLLIEVSFIATFTQRFFSSR